MNSMNGAPLLHEAKPNLRDYIAVIRKRIWTIVAIFVVVVTLVAIWNFKATPVYRASVKILIEPADPKVVNIEEVLGRNTQMAEYQATQHQLLQSQTLARRVVKALNLSNQGGFGLPRQDDGLSLQNLTSSAIRSTLGFVRGLVEKGPGPKEVAAQNSLFTPEERAVLALLGRLEVEPVRLTRLVLVHFDDVDPAMAARVANTLGEHYLKMNLDLRFTTTREASEWLSGEIGKVREGLAKAEQALQAYREKNNTVSLEDRQNIILQKLGELNTAVTKARTERIALEVVANRVQRADGDIEALTSLPDVIDNPVMQRLKGEYFTLLRELSNSAKRYKDQHPKLVRLNSQIQATKKKLEEETREISKTIMTRFQVAVAREKSLAQSLEEQKHEALRLNRHEIQYQSLKREVDTSRRLYEDVLKRTKETDLLEALKTTNIRIVDQAEVPKTPVRPRKMRNILVAIAVSFFFGLGFVFLLDHLDTRIRAPEEVEAITGAPVIGTVPDLGWKLKRVTLISSRGPALIEKEYFREIRAMAAFRLGVTHKVIQVTSCVPREGKTFLAANLALAFSDGGKKVLLIDGDLHRAEIHGMFRLRPKPGLIQVFLGEANLSDSIRPIAKMSLSVLPAGRMRGTSTKLFEAADFRSVIQSLKADFDYIVVDSPPLLAVSDPLVWSQCVDGVFFVVDVQQVTVDMLRQSVGKFKELEVPILGAIMNRLTKNHNYYYYGYYKKYDYYHRKKSQGTEERA